MWRWLRRETAARRRLIETAAVVHVAAPGPAPPSATTAPAPVAAPAVDAGRLTGWLLDAPPLTDAAASTAELEALAAIDALLVSDQRLQALLPRAPAVIPQLLGALRRRESSLPMLVERVAKDLVLTAEVMRMARSVAYSRDGEVHDLGRAIAALGEQGMQRAIARVVLRPMMQAGGGRLSATAAQRLWDHTEQQSILCGRHALAMGIDPFDAYLAGLLHNAGWSVALRLLDLRTPPPWPWSRDFAEALVARCDPLFGKVVGSWQVSAGLNALAAEALQPGLAQACSGLARLLLECERQASAQLLPLAPAAPPRALEQACAPAVAEVACTAVLLPDPPPQPFADTTLGDGLH